jgi:hypothetical protein
LEATLEKVNKSIHLKNKIKTKGLEAYLAQSVALLPQVLDFGFNPQYWKKSDLGNGVLLESVASQVNYVKEYSHCR